MTSCCGWGAQKKFDVFKFFGNERLPVGHASVEDVRLFMLASDPKVPVPRVTNLAKAGRPKTGDVVRLMLMSTLDMNDEYAADAAADFDAAWDGLDCRHGAAICTLRKEWLHVTCADCGADMSFRFMGGDAFAACLSRPGSAQDRYGVYDAEAVVQFVRKFAGSLRLPVVVADRMSDDPDRDADGLAEVAALLEEYGLLRRIGVVRDDMVKEMAEQLSAAVCTRREFNRMAREFIRRVRDTEQYKRHGGAAVRFMLESAWLTWPHWFEGDGISVYGYDPTGELENCIRCGFSTLDDDGTDDRAWKNGCPECGYNGHLLGLNKKKA